MYKEFVEVKECVRKARSLFCFDQNMKIQNKTSHQDIVTIYDQKIEKYLRDALSNIMEGVTFVGEEGTKEISDSMFIIDPIDGTTNFCNLNQNFTISVAYYKEKKPVFGIVYDVMANVMYSAYRNQGAYMNEHRVYLQKKEFVVKEAVFDASLSTLLEQPEYFTRFKEMRGHRSCGCASLAIVMVALQKLDFYVSSHVKVWDYAAAVIFLMELNGCWSMQKNFFSCESNPSIFAREEAVLRWIS